MFSAAVNAETHPNMALPGGRGIVSQHVCSQYAVMQHLTNGDADHGTCNDILRCLNVVKRMKGEAQGPSVGQRRISHLQTDTPWLYFAETHAYSAIHTTKQSMYVYIHETPLLHA